MVSDFTAFFKLTAKGAGMLMVFGPTNEDFTNPTKKLTENYITGCFG